MTFEKNKKKTKKKFLNMETCDIFVVLKRQCADEKVFRNEVHGRGG